MKKIKNEPYIVSWRTKNTIGTNSATFSNSQKRKDYIENVLHKNKYVIQASIFTYKESVKN